MWRRQATGTVAEILGEKALRRDIGSRLLKFRGDLHKELGSYHPQGEKIVSSFVKGLNAYIDLTRKSPDLLPVEFRLFGITPGRWTTEIVVSRHNGLFRNATTETRLARAVQAIGPEKLREFLDLHPGNPDLRPADGLDLSLITDKVIELYGEAREPLRFALEDVVDRAAWLESGCAPYLASLQIDQARSWPEFQEACFKNRTPSENMVWADREGNIGWQVTGLMPIRPNWPGLLPVPGDGKYEWAGTIPAPELPFLLNPPSGFIATANQDNVPEGYPHQVGYLWADPFRFLRITEVLGSGRTMDLSDMKNLQQDVLSLPARRLVPLLKNLRASTPLAQKAMEELKAWDLLLSPQSGAAAFYVAWERALLDNLSDALIPETARAVPAQLPLDKAIGWLEKPDCRFGPNPDAERDRLLIFSLERAIDLLTKRFGPDPARWHYGDPNFHHVQLHHPLSGALREDLRRQFDLGPFPRGGDGETVNNTSDGDNQTSGATFRIIADLADWNLSVGTNAPGQSGIPRDPHYSDLLIPWVEGGYFPIYFGREKIISAAEKTIRMAPLKPRG